MLRKDCSLGSKIIKLILSPDAAGRAAGGKKPSSPEIQREYSDDGVPSSWIQYNQIVRHRYVLIVFMVCSVFFPSAVRTKYNYLRPSPVYLREETDRLLLPIRFMFSHLNLESRSNNPVSVTIVFRL